MLDFLDFCVGMVIKVMRIDYVETRSDFEISRCSQTNAASGCTVSLVQH